MILLECEVFAEGHVIDFVAMHTHEPNCGVPPLKRMYNSSFVSIEHLNTSPFYSNCGLFKQSPFTCLSMLQFNRG
jgi:hypothetical protein